MNANILYSDLIARKHRLIDVGKSMKEKFIGLDEVIDEVVSVMMPWYLFPDAQLRPTVVNLWGLTGSGKSALVHAISEALQYENLYSHIDMGEFESDSATWIKKILTEDLTYFDGKSAIICLDEFQFARTLDSGGNELGKDKLRVIWELLDSGKIEYIPDDAAFYLFRADDLLKRMENIRHKITFDKGIVGGDVETFLRTFDGYYMYDYHRANTSRDAGYFLSEEFVDGIHGLFFTDNITKKVLKNRIQQCTLDEFLMLIKEGMSTRPATRVLNLSRSLIFVLGNLDEAYPMSRSMNPDISADEFYEATSKITIADIKWALGKRFRTEQIARLGNNHVIYRSFNSEQFRTFIKQELKRVRDFVLQKFGWQVIFEQSVVDIVYAEGVFPAQGTRPVLTTIKNLIESKISSIAVSILEQQLDLTEIVWAYAGDNFFFAFKNGSGQVISSISVHANLKLDNLRKSIDPGIQAHTAVHESGHAILAALLFRILPATVVSRTASDAEGFCLVNFPKGPVTREVLRKDIVITLGGYVAEKIVFGEENTCSGVYLDIEQASSMANRAVRKYAMGSDPIHLAVASSGNEDAFFQVEKYNAEAVQLVRDCEQEAHKLILRNKYLLLKMSAYLTKHSRMEEEMIGEFVRQYSKEDWVMTEGFIKREHYFAFDDVISEQLKSLDIESGTCIIEQMMNV